MKDLRRAPLMTGWPRRVTAALAPAYCIGLTVAFSHESGLMEALKITVPFAVMSAVPLLFRRSQAFNSACYWLSVLGVIVGCVFGGVLFLPAVVPLLLAARPSLRAPIPQLSVAVVLAALAWGINRLP
ncbi:hypothetical protein [Actinoplanes palleronii]|nr:hypothetical protein [Actinoplanes palleronii]